MRKVCCKDSAVSLDSSVYRGNVIVLFLQNIRPHINTFFDLLSKKRETIWKACDNLKFDGQSWMQAENHESSSKMFRLDFATWRSKNNRQIFTKYLWRFRWRVALKCKSSSQSHTKLIQKNNFGALRKLKTLALTKKQWTQC